MSKLGEPDVAHDPSVNSTNKPPQTPETTTVFANNTDKQKNTAKTTPPYHVGPYPHGPKLLKKRTKQVKQQSPNMENGMLYKNN